MVTVPWKLMVTWATTTPKRIANQIGLILQQLRLYHMNNSKSQAYHQKILQLLLREKAVEAVNQTLTRENQTIKEKITSINRTHEAELQEFREQLQSNISKAEMEIRIAKRGRNAEEEKRVELEGQVEELTQSISKISNERQQFEERSKGLERQLTECQEELSQKIAALSILEQRHKKQEEVLRKLGQKNQINQQQIEQLFTQKSNLNKVTSKLQADLSQTKQLYEDALQKIQSFKNEVAVKNKLKLQKEGENSKYEAMLQQLTKENGLLRERRKKLEEDVKLLQQQKEQSQDSLKRAEKLSKKNKQAIADHEAKIKELQDQCATLGDKSRNLDRFLKAAKREIQQLQQNLQSLEDTKNAEANKYKKYESLTKTQKNELTDKQQQLQQLQQASLQLKKQLESSQRNTLQLSLQVERLAKENRYLSEQSQQQQEKRILLQGQKQKAISIIIRDKDVLSRANFKLLQLLELKDQAIKAILDSLENKADRIDVAPMLDCDQLLKTIRSADKEKLRNKKDRVTLLQEWVKAKK